MKKIHQKDVHIISRHSNLTKDEVDRILKENVYHNKEAWYTFFRYFLISLGVGFTVSGIVFFFAYNWADLHKFAKIGLTEGMLLATVVIVLLVKMNDQIRNIVLTGASVLVGVLFAVFGQIYQTGADAYDFFLAWTLFITLWVCVAHFAPLWLLYLVLINTTLLLYTQQVAQDWSVVFICFLLFSINTTVVIAAILLRKHAIPNWFLYIVSLASVSYATVGIILGIFDNYQTVFPILLLMTTIVFVLGIRHGLKTESGFYLSMIPFSLIVIVSALLIKISDAGLMFLFVGLFVITSVMLTIKNLIDLQKKWNK